MTGVGLVQVGACGADVTGHAGDVGELEGNGLLRRVECYLGGLRAVLVLYRGIRVEGFFIASTAASLSMVRVGGGCLPPFKNPQLQTLRCQCPARVPPPLRHSALLHLGVPLH